MNHIQSKLCFSLLIIASLVLYVGCKKVETMKKNDYPREEILMGIYDNQIQPSFERYQQSIDSLYDAYQDFLNEPSQEQFDNLKNRFSSSYVTWQSVALWNFGPFLELSLVSEMNTYPADADAIYNTAESGVYTFTNPTVPKNLQGFPALDVLFFHVPDGDENAKSKFANPKIVKYTDAIINHMKSRAQQAVDACSMEYRSEFISKSSLDKGSAIGMLYNTTILPYFELHIREAKFGIPAGARTGQPLSGHIEAIYSQKTITNGLAAVDAYINLWLTPDSTSFIAYVESIDKSNGTQFAKSLKEQFQVLRESILKLQPEQHFIQENLEQGHFQDMLEIWKNAQECVVIIKTDIASALGLSITYVDNDGD